LGLGFLTDGLRVPQRKFIAATLLVSGTLAWFFLINFEIYDIFGGIAQNELLWNYYNIGQIFFYGFAIFSALVGSFIAKRFNRTILLISWISLGIFATVSLTLFQGTALLAISSILMGVSLGFGLPSSMSFIAECTVVKERARVSGAIILVTFLLALTAFAIILLLRLDVMRYILLFAVVRAVSLLALAIDKCDGKDEKVTEKLRLPNIAFKEYLFYLVPWIMFCVAAGLARNLVPDTPDYEPMVSLGTSLRWVCIAVFGLASGIIADRIGRKQPIIIGLITLGISFALLGFAMSPTTVFIYLIVSGAAWGSFFVIFLTVPGDLSVRGSREKFYGLGYILPLAILFALAAVPGIAIFSSFSASSFALILSIILFVAVIPVQRANETLPLKEVDERKMKEHLKKIGKVVKEAKDE
jgi:MFS family permease